MQRFRFDVPVSDAAAVEVPHSGQHLAEEHSHHRLGEAAGFHPRKQFPELAHVLGNYIAPGWDFKNVDQFSARTPYPLQKYFKTYKKAMDIFSDNMIFENLEIQTSENGKTRTHIVDTLKKTKNGKWQRINEN